MTSHYVTIATLLLHIYDINCHYCIFICWIPPSRWPEAAETCRRINILLYPIVSTYSAVISVRTVKCLSWKWICRIELHKYYLFLWTGWRSRYSDCLRAGRYGDRIPVEVRFSAPVQTGREANPASCTMGTGPFPGVRCGRGVTLIPHPLLVQTSKTE